MRVTAIILASFVALAHAGSGKYLCAEVADTKFPTLKRCQGASKAELVNIFVDFCCKPGSGDKGQMDPNTFDCECPELAPATCVDDISGAVFDDAQTDCEELKKKAGGDCSKLLTDVSTDVPKELTLTVGSSLICPLTCGTCSKAKPTALCKDDFDGMLKQNGETCAKLMTASNNNCQKLLHDINIKIPTVGNLRIADACPITCKSKTCDGHISEVASLSADGSLTQTSHSAAALIGVAGVVAGVAIVALVAKGRRTAAKQQAQTETTITPTNMASL